MSYTLLEMTQHILSSLDSDEVNSISDTTESLQVAHIIKGSYYDLITDLDLMEHNSLYQLNASGDADKPTLMFTPDNIKRTSWIKYNKQADDDTYPNFSEVTLLSLEDFITMMTNLRDSSNIGSQLVSNNSETFEFIYRSDKDPDYYTVLDDYTLVFDSYDETKDTTLQKSKTMCSGVAIPIWSMTDNFTPDINSQQFSLLLNRAKTKAFVELKQTENLDAARETRRQRVINQYQKQKTEKFPAISTAPRYGKP